MSNATLSPAEKRTQSQDIVHIQQLLKRGEQKQNLTEVLLLTSRQRGMSYVRTSDTPHESTVVHSAQQFNNHHGYTTTHETQVHI